MPIWGICSSSSVKHTPHLMHAMCSKEERSGESALQAAQLPSFTDVLFALQLMLSPSTPLQLVALKTSPKEGGEKVQEKTHFLAPSMHYCGAVPSIQPHMPKPLRQQQRQAGDTDGSNITGLQMGGWKENYFNFYPTVDFGREGFKQEEFLEKVSSA